MDSTIQKKLFDICERYSDKIAIEYGEEKLTYFDLDKITNEIANYILEQGIPENTHIGIMSKDRIGIILSMIGILKARSIFVILDPDAPKNRLQSMIEFSDIAYILGENNLVENINDNNFNSSIKIINYNWILQNSNKQIAFRPNLQYCGNDKIYLFFTSGSTGDPKAIMGKNDSIVHFAEWEINAFSIDNNFRMSQFTIPTNDAFLRDVFVPLFSGATLCIPKISEIVLSDRELINWVSDNKIELIHCTPSLFYVLNGELLNADKIKSLKYIFTVGEALKKEKLKYWYDIINDKVKIINLYGSTESGLAKMFHEVQESDLERKSIPIGKELPKVRTIILDEKLKPCEQGDIGELYIRTSFLSHGYYKNEKLTKEVFIVNPFTKKENDIIYKTGDLARIEDDGNFQLIGRADRQIKIRGNRVEISEIENVILRFDGISNCVVNFYNDEKTGDISLAAYVICKEKIEQSKFRTELRNFIPEYMIPKHIVEIENIPLTASGKVNYDKLPFPDTQIDEEYIAPKNEFEKNLEKIWCEILNLERISINKSFFDVGGHSLKVMNLISKVYRVFGVELPFEIIFENPSLMEMAKYIGTQLNNADVTKSSGYKEEQQKAQLTPMQQWFVSQNVEDKRNCNQTATLFSRHGFEVEKVNCALETLLIRHAELHVRYNSLDNSMEVTKNYDEYPLKVIVYDFKDKLKEGRDINNLWESTQERLEINKGPLIKIQLFRVKNGDYLFITIHGFIMDNFSWKILIEDFEKAYQMDQYEKETVINDQINIIGKWCDSLREYSHSSKFIKEIEYWNKVEKQEIIKLPRNEYKAPEERKNIKLKDIYFSKEQTNALLTRANQAYNTQINELLLTAIVSTIYDWTENNKILINIVSHSREYVTEQINISREIGCFAIQYPVVIEAQKEKISKVIKNVKETLRNIPSKGIGYGVIRYLSNEDIGECIKFKLNPEILFNEVVQLDNILATDKFEILDLDFGHVVRGAASLSFSSIIKEGQLKVVVDYYDEEYEEKTIEKLLLNLKENLINIVNHCMEIEESEITISDLVMGDIDTQGLLDYINSLD
ncbi:non-ribosomal peptide synthetase [Clostridium tagluense]|uniref:non-ribosomal peptide synthetase n=1 Tax=Clostridium tagluense TaxID=360422 RepID=UPI001CF56F19|nr:non-ribosomal peptide synthetase [Clostridium tagluense]MCB2298645.1 amino acid adenylation domain-containing protein [Clostridium tagluense]